MMYLSLLKIILQINQLDIPPDEKVRKLLLRFSGLCGAIAVQPIPFADIFVLTPIQLYMGTLIAEANPINFQCLKYSKKF